MTEHLLFTARDEFRSWLETNCISSGGIWLLFGKTGGSKTIKANESLEEALPIAFFNIKAQEKTNFKLIDTRSCQENLQVIENRCFIGRGLEVKNRVIK